jgi:lysyl oxidase
MPLRRALALALLGLLTAVPPALARDVLPDLDQASPDNLQVTSDRSGAIPRFHLGFDSAVDNRGPGPLVIAGHRDSAAETGMVADQTISQSDGSTRSVAGVGSLEYVYSGDHDHWHLLGFDRYELRRAGNYRLVAPDQKTGFCLGDRYETDSSTTAPGEPGQAFYTGYCGRTQTQLLSLVEGISPGYGDIYFANLEGQFVDVTGIPAGEYYLVHRVNADRKLAERDYGNDAASLRIAASWPNGRTEAPSVKLLRRCAAHDTCPGPRQRAPVLTRAAAERYARTGVRRVLGFRPRGFAIACKRVRSRVARTCSVRGVHAHRRYSLKAKVAYERRRNGVLYVRYSVGRKHGLMRIGRAPASAAVAEPRKRLVALDDPPLDGIRLRPVVHEVPRLVRHPLGRLGRRVPAQ